VSTDKRHWQKAFDRLKGYKSLRTRELERELSAVRNDYLLLEQSTDNLAGERDAALESLAGTERELQSLHSEFTAARQERNQLEFDFQNSMAVLTGKFEAVQSEIQRLDTQLAERDRMLLEYASERDAARDQVRFLESLLEETSSRQQVTEQQVEALQKDLAGERAFHRRPSLWMK